MERGGGGGEGGVSEHRVGLRFVSQMTISSYRCKIRTLYTYLSFAVFSETLNSCVSCVVSFHDHTISGVVLLPSLLSTFHRR